MRWAELAVRTLRDAPAGARNDRDRLLARAGLVRLGPGSSYEWLPLGQRVLRKVAAIVEAERAGASDAALRRALTRCGLDEVVVAQGPGVTLYLAPAANGEAAALRCPACSYAATAEAASCRVTPGPWSRPDGGEPGPGRDRPAIEERPTPGVHTIAQLAETSGIPADRQIKILFYRVTPVTPVAPVAPVAPESVAPVPVAQAPAVQEPASRAPGSRPGLVAALVRGDRALNEAKLAQVLGVPGVALATREEILDQTGAPIGSAGPVGLRGARLVADQEVMVLVDTVCGANEEGHHLFNVNPGRDFVPNQVADVRTAGPGDACPRCGRPLASLRGVVVARLKTEPQGFAGAAPPGGSIPEPAVDPGSVVAAVADRYHDEAGIAWPLALAPCQAVVVPVNAADPSQVGAAETIHRELLALGVEAVLDDRDERAGFKFTDADLIGFPFRVTVGPRSLAEGQAEVLERATRAETRVPVAEAAAWVAGRTRPPA